MTFHLMRFTSTLTGQRPFAEGDGAQTVVSGLETSQNTTSALSLQVARQTNNRAELVTIILTIRKVMTLPHRVSRLVVHSDSRLCIDGINKWLPFLGGRRVD